MCWSQRSSSNGHLRLDRKVSEGSFTVTALVVLLTDFWCHTSHRCTRLTEVFFSENKQTNSDDVEVLRTRNHDINLLALLETWRSWWQWRDKLPVGEWYQSIANVPVTERDQSETPNCAFSNHLVEASLVSSRLTQLPVICNCQLLSEL